MPNNLFKGAIAGLVAGVLYFTVGTGTLFSLLLFYLAPLPLFIAGQGWGTLAAAIGSGVGCVLVALFAGAETSALFMATVAIPAVLLTHISLLSRVTGDDKSPTVEWYPLGRIVIWVAAISAALVAFAVIVLGPDAASFESAIRDWFNEILDANGGIRDQLVRSNSTDVASLVEFLVWALPPASAALWMLTTLLNIFLASVVVEHSGLSMRSRSIYSSLDLPAKSVLALGCALALSLVPGLVGIVSVSLATALTACFALQGLAVVHVLSRLTAYRPAILGLTYLLLVLGSWIGVTVVVALGLLETVLRLRDQFTNRGGPLTSDQPT